MCSIFKSMNTTLIITLGKPKEVLKSARHAGTETRAPGK